MEKKTTEKQKVSVKKQQWKPGNMLYPLPAVLVSLGREGEKPNLITVAWTGTVCTNPPMVYISVRPERYSYSILKETKTFVINLTTEKLLKATDYCGVRSGRDVDKFADCGLTAVPAQGMDCAPAIAQCPLYLACKTQQVIELGSHDLFIARIAGMGVREELLDEKGKIDLRRAGLTAYSHGVYYALGDATGFFGYSVAAPEVRKRRMRELK